MNEHSLHSEIKEWYAVPGDRIEVKIDDFIIDIARGTLLIEIQTRNFSAIKSKLSNLVENHQVRLVHPIPERKWIVRVTETGKIVGRRIPPRKGRLERARGRGVIAPVTLSLFPDKASSKEFVTLLYIRLSRYLWYINGYALFCGLSEINPQVATLKKHERAHGERKLIKAFMLKCKDYYYIRCIFNVMKEQNKKLIVEFLKNSKRSDRELARVLNSSQPTITRARQKLEREGLIRGYTIVADWRKLGFEIMTFTFAKMRAEMRSEEMLRKAKQYTAKSPCSIYVAFGEGFGMTGVIISLHRSYREYMQELSLFRIEWKDYIEDIKSFTTALGENEIRELSFKYLAEALLKQDSNKKNQ